MLFIQIYFIGVTISVAALIANVIASQFHIVTWYDFVKKPSSVRWFYFLWLFLLYLALLGVAAYGTTFILGV